MDENQIDPRARLTASQLAILSDASQLLGYLAGNNAAIKQDIFKTGYFNGRQAGRRDIREHIEILHYYSAIVDPDNIFAIRYRWVVGKFVPGRRVDWSQSGHPLEELAAEITYRFPSFREKLSMTVTDTSPIIDPATEYRKKKEEEYRKLIQQYEREFGSDLGDSVVGMVPKIKMPKKEEEKKAEEETEKKELSEEEKFEELLRKLKEGKKDDGTDMDEFEKELHLAAFGFTPEEARLILANKDLFTIPDSADKAEFDEWRKKAHSEVAKMKERRAKEEEQEELTKNSAQPPVPPVMKAPTEPLQRAATPIRSGIAAKPVPPRIIGPKPVPKLSLPTKGSLKGAALGEGTAVAAKRAANVAQPFAKKNLDIIASKVRQVVHEHPTSTATIATGLVTGAVLQTTLNVPFPIGFLGGAGSVQAISRINQPRVQQQEEQQMQEQQDEADQAAQAQQEQEASNTSPSTSSGAALAQSSSTLGHFIVRRPFIAGALVLLGIIVLMFISQIMGYLPPFQKFGDQPGQNAKSQLVVKKTGPASVEKYSVGDTISYSISVTNRSGNAISAEITDTLPADTSYVTSAPTGVASGNTVKWNLTSLLPEVEQTISLTVKVEKDMKDTWVVNSASGVGLGSSSGPIGGVGGACPTSEEIAANRKDTQSCKGLNAAIPVAGVTLGQDAVLAFIAKYGKGDPVFAQRTQTIIEKSKITGINPALVLGLWRSESNFGNNLGCRDLPSVFETQVDCATGQNGKGSIATRCGISRDANSSACKLAHGILTSKNNQEIYSGDYAFNVPIATIDDFMKLTGPFNPQLAQIERRHGINRPASEDTNNNCRHSYNIVLEVALGLGVCNPTATTPSTPGVVNSNLAQCKFYRNDQQQNENCPPSGQGFRCAQALEFKSPLLLSYITAASQKTGVPAEVLAAFVRVESTVPVKYSATKKSYSISDYTDEDVRQMKNPITSNGDIDATIGDTNKAMCPRSTTGALGLMQIQPPQQVHNAVLASINENNKKRSVQYAVPAADQPSKSTPGNIDAAARAIGKTKETLTVDDFCDPQKSMIMAAHVFFGKMNMTSWNPPKDAVGYEAFITKLAEGYYGKDGQTGAYGNSVWRSVSSCKPN